MKVSQLFEASNLGNLRKLKLSPSLLANITRSSYRRVFKRNLIGPNSEIVNLGNFISIDNVKELISANPDIKGVVFYVNGKSGLIVVADDFEDYSSARSYVSIDSTVFDKDLLDKMRTFKTTLEVSSLVELLDKIESVVELGLKVSLMGIKLDSSSETKRDKRERDKIKDDYIAPLAYRVEMNVIKKKAKKVSSLKELAEYVKEFAGQDTPHWVQYKNVIYILPQVKLNRPNDTTVAIHAVFGQPNLAGRIVIQYIDGDVYYVAQHDYKGPVIEDEIVNPELMLERIYQMFKLDKNSSKDEVIKKLLNLYKTENFESARQFVNALKAMKKDWSELDAIEKSLKATKAEEEI